MNDEKLKTLVDKSASELMKHFKSVKIIAEDDKGLYEANYIETKEKDEPCPAPHP